LYLLVILIYLLPETKKSYICSSRCPLRLLKCWCNCLKHCRQR